MSTRSLGCRYSLDVKCRKKANPLEVLKEVNINWKLWQPKIHYENMIEVDVKVKAEFLFFFHLIIQMPACGLRGCLWEIPPG